MKAFRNKVYTIDLQVKEWFDKVNGNSYFSGIITVNYGRKNQFQISLPFQYGYGNHSEDTAFKALQTNKVFKDVLERESFWQYYSRKGIIYRYNKYENCLKRDVINYCEL